MKVYLELHSRFWGGINGKLSLSLEEGAPLLGLGKSTVRRALIELEEIGGKLPSVAIPSREASQMGHAGLKEVARQWQLIVPQTSVRDPHMRILMLCANGLPQPDAPRGGPIYYWQNLQALVQLGHEVHLRIIAPASPVPTEILSKLASCAFIPLKKSHSISHKIKMISPKFRRINHLAPNYVTIWEDIRRQYDAVQPEMIWADWIGSLVASYEVDQVPIVYALHDFAFRIEQVKRKTNPLRVSSRARASIKSFRDMEFEIIRKASAIASASAIESEIVQRNTGVISEYIPIVGDYVNKSFGDKIGINCKYFIFGNTNTAMKASRIDLKQNILSSKQMRRLDWHHVGRIPQSERKKWSDAVSGSDMNFHGYVKDLGDVFDPGDALVTPYPEGTGFRTKFVTAAAYGMDRASVAVT